MRYCSRQHWYISSDIPLAAMSEDDNTCVMKLPVLEGVAANRDIATASIAFYYFFRPNVNKYFGKPRASDHGYGKVIASGAGQIAIG